MEQNVIHQLKCHNRKLKNRYSIYYKVFIYFNMDCFVNQDILSYLDFDTKVIAKRIDSLWFDILNKSQSKDVILGWQTAEDQLLWDGCCEGSIRKIVNGSKCWNIGLGGSCFSGNIKTAELMIEKGANSWNEALERACYNGSIELIKLINDKGKPNYDCGLASACYAGKLEVVKLMITYGATKFNVGLGEVCRGNKGCDKERLDIVKLLITSGADNLTFALETACMYDNYAIAIYLLEKGVDELNIVLSSVCQINHFQMIKLIVNNGANNCEWCHKSMNEHLLKK